jgi:predicted acylesterase/phospholipase RssA
VTPKRSLGYNPLAEGSTDLTLRELVGERSDHDPDRTPRPVAIVLGGRGGEAASEVGVLEVLLAGRSPATDNTPLRPSLVVGSSFGAFNSAVLAARWQDGPTQAVGELERTWRKRLAHSSRRPGNGVFRLRSDPLDLMNPARMLQRPAEPLAQLADDGAFFARDWLARGLDFMRSSASLSHRFLALPDLSTLVSTAPFARLLEETVEPDRLRASALELVVVATGWESGQPRVFQTPELAAADGHSRLRGAVALPGIFPAVTVDGEPLLDGSATSDPLAPALERGAGEIHVVETAVQAEGSKRECSTLEVLEHYSRWQARSMWERSLARVEHANQAAARDRRPLIVVHRHRPRVKRNDTLSVLDFSPGRIGSAIEAGRRAAAEHDCHLAGCLGVGRA